MSFKFSKNIFSLNPALGSNFHLGKFNIDSLALLTFNKRFQHSTTRSVCVLFQLNTSEELPFLYGATEHNFNYIVIWLFAPEKSIFIELWSRKMLIYSIRKYLESKLS